MLSWKEQFDLDCETMRSRRFHVERIKQKLFGLKEELGMPTNLPVSEVKKSVFDYQKSIDNFMLKEYGIYRIGNWINSFSNQHETNALYEKGKNKSPIYRVELTYYSNDVLARIIIPEANIEFIPNSTEIDEKRTHFKKVLNGI